jgi:hypothetical protein
MMSVGNPRRNLAGGVFVARKKLVARKKRRTRVHVIADLSANYVERQALLCGYSVERRWHDYGIDLVIATYDQRGDVENGEILVQLKATDHLKLVSRGQMVTCRIERADLRAWLHEPMPVILVVYDAANDTAFWLYVQQHFHQRPGFNPQRGSVELTVRIPRDNLVNISAVQHFARCRDHLLAQMEGLQHDLEE